MARIPLQSLVSARQSGVAIAPGVFQQTAEAAHGLLSSVAGATQMVKAQFDKAQDIHNQSAISEGRRSHRDAQAEFQKRMLDPKFTPAMWGPEWQETLKSLETTLDDSDMPPVVSRALNEDFQAFAGSSLIQISGAALKENLKKGKENFQRDYQFNKAEGRHQDNLKLIDESVGVLLDEASGDDWKRQTNGMIKQDSMKVHKSNDPRGYIEAVKGGEYDLSELHQIEEIKSGENQMDVYESEGLDIITSMVKAGDQIKNVDQLKIAIVNNPNISELNGKAYIANYKNSQPLQDGEMFALDDKIDELWKFRGDPDRYRKEWSKINILVGTYGTRGGIRGAKARLYQDRPSQHTKEKLDKAAEEQRDAELRPITIVARELVKEHSTGLAELSYLRGENEDPLNRKEDIANAILKNEYDRHAIVVREKLQTMVNEFIQQPGERKTPLEVDAFIKANTNEENFKTMRTERDLNSGGINSAPGTLLPGIVPGSKEAKIAEDWLNKK